MILNRLSILIVALLVLASCQSGSEGTTETSDDQEHSIGSPFEQQGELDEVTDEELEQFAAALTQIQLLDQESQEQMMNAVEGEGMDLQRFNEIHQAQMDPSIDAGVTDQEAIDFDNIMQLLEVIQGDMQGKMEGKILEEGISLEKYQQLMVALQSDEELQQRFQQIIQQQQQPQ